MKIIVFLTAVLASALPSGAATPAADSPPPNATDKEIEMGRKASAEFEKDPKTKLGKPTPTQQATPTNNKAASVATPKTTTTQAAPNVTVASSVAALPVNATLRKRVP